MNDTRQHTLWLLAAVAAPIAHFSGGGWLAGAAAALAVLPLSLIPGSWELPRFLGVLELLWLGIVAGLLLPGSAAYWPSDNTTVVPLTILALAALTDGKAAPRIGAVLALCMALLAVPMAASAVGRLEPAWLTPTLRLCAPGLILALLLPALPAAGELKGRGVILPGALTVLLSALVQGVLGGAEVRDPFYETARTLGHMEPVAAAAMTLGWYALTCLLLQSGYAIAQNCGIRRKTAGLLQLATAAVLVAFPQEWGALPVIGVSLILWRIVPVAARKNFF